MVERDPFFHRFEATRTRFNPKNRGLKRGLTVEARGWKKEGKTHNNAGMKIGLACGA